MTETAATTATRKKLIEVAIPLDAINAASAREKSIRHGHPSTLRLWWARRPLAACRAVLFAQWVDDPSSHPDRFPTREAVDAERKRLFDIIEELVQWGSSTNEEGPEIQSLLLTVQEVFCLEFGRTPGLCPGFVNRTAAKWNE